MYVYANERRGACSHRIKRKGNNVWVRDKEKKNTAMSKTRATKESNTLGPFLFHLTRAATSPPVLFIHHDPPHLTAYFLPAISRLGALLAARRFEHHESAQRNCITYQRRVSPIHTTNGVRRLTEDLQGRDLVPEHQDRARYQKDVLYGMSNALDRARARTRRSEERGAEKDI